MNEEEPVLLTTDTGLRNELQVMWAAVDRFTIYLTKFCKQRGVQKPFSEMTVTERLKFAQMILKLRASIGD